MSRIFLCFLAFVFIEQTSQNQFSDGYTSCCLNTIDIRTTPLYPNTLDDAFYVSLLTGSILSTPVATQDDVTVPTACIEMSQVQLSPEIDPFSTSNHKRDLGEFQSTQDEPILDSIGGAESPITMSTPTSNKQEINSERTTSLASFTLESTLQARSGLRSPGPEATEIYPTVYTTTQLEVQSSLVSFYRSREAARENLMDILIGSLIGISAAFFITFSVLIYLSVWMWRKSHRSLCQQDSYLNFLRTDPRIFMDTSPSINKSVTTEDPYYNRTMYSGTVTEDLEQREVDSINNPITKYSSSSSDAISRPPRSFVRSASWFMHRLSPTAMPHVAFASPRRGPWVNSALRISTASLRLSETSGPLTLDSANHAVHHTPISPPAPWSSSHSQSIEILPANLSPLDSPSDRGIKSSCF